MRFLSKLNLQRKIISSLLCITLIGLLSVLAASADGGAALEIGETSAKPGETVAVSFNLQTNPGIAALRLKIEYDTSRLTINNASAVLKGTALGGLSYVGPNEQTIKNNPFAVLWFGVADDTSAGALLSIDFTVLNDAPAGDAYIKAMLSEPEDSVNAGWACVDLTIKNGKITVAPPEQGIPTPQGQPKEEEPPTEQPKEAEIIKIDNSFVPETLRPATDGSDLFVVYGNENEKYVPVTIPYIYNNEGNAPAPENLVVYRVDTVSGKTEPVGMSLYDAGQGRMDFIGRIGEIYMVTANKVSFKDVSANDWFFDAVSFVTSRALFLGVGDALFAPAATMTRGMFLTVMARLDGADLSEYGVSPYSDTDIGQYYGKPIAWAADVGIIEAGIVEGCEPGMFEPGDEITREQMAAIFAGYIKYKDLNVKTTEQPEFSDIGQAGEWAKAAIGAMRSHGIINGVGDNLYNPKGKATRAEVAQIFTNLVNAVINVE